MSRPRIFISYARRSTASRAPIAELETALDTAGFQVLRDEHMRLGERWHDRLDSWLETCHGAVIVIGRDALGSEWVRSEADHLARRCALREAFVVVPVLCDGLEWAEVDAAFPVARLSRFQSTDALVTADIVRALEPTRALVALPDALSSGRAARPAATPANLLRPAQEAMPFVLRPDEQGRLRAWLDSEATVAVQLVYGAGGVGKTRLALQVAAERSAAGWTAGFLRPEADAGELRDLVASDDPVLVVVDYAATREPQVLALLRAAAEPRSPGATPRVRVLLLARNAGEWWDQLPDRDAEVGDLVASSPLPIHLAGHRAPEARAALFSDAVEAYATALGRQPPRIELPAGLDSEPLGRPLYLQMAALHAVIAEPGQSWGSAADLLDKVLGHEGRFWETWLDAEGQHVRANTIQAVRFALAAVTLAGGSPSHAVLVRHVRIGLGTRPGAESYCALLAALYPNAEGSRGLEPDVLGEHLVQRALERDAALLDRLLDDPACEAATRRSALTLLTRGAARTGERRWLAAALAGRLAAMVDAAMEVAVETGFPLGLVLGEAFATDGDLELAKRLEGRFPEPTVALRELALGVAQTLLDGAPAGDDPEARAERAKRSFLLSIRLPEVGRAAEGVAIAELAVAGFRELVPEDPPRFRPHLAASLNALAIGLNALGRREEALARTRDAVTTYTSVLDTGAATHELGMLLNNLGMHLSELGEHAEALTVAERAVGVFRELARDGAQEPLASLSMSLVNLGRHRSHLGQLGPALDAAREAVDINTKLARLRPDAFLPDLARSQSNLSVHLGQLRREAGALDAARAAVDIYRPLAAARPMAFLGELARSLVNLANQLAAVGRRTEALDVTLEARELYERFARASPEGSDAMLALCNYILAIRYSEAGRPLDSVEPAQRAVELWRPLAELRPNAFLPDLARGLNTLGNRLSEVGRSAEAVEAAEESVALCRHLVERGVPSGLPDLARGLQNLGNRLADVGNEDAALAATQEAVETHRRVMAEAGAELYLPELAASLNDLGVRLAAAGRYEDALAATEEAIRIRKSLAEALPEAHLASVAQSLDNLAVDLHRLRRSEEAVVAAREALSLHRSLGASGNAAIRPALAGNLHNLGVILEAAGDRDGALEAFREVRSVYGELAVELPDRFASDLAISHLPVVDLLRQLARTDEALAESNEAIAWFRASVDDRVGLVPHFARLLGLRGQILQSTGSHEEARRSFEEGIRVLYPVFVASPASTAAIMHQLATAYLQSCNETGLPPDPELVASVEEVFQALPSGGDEP